MSADLSALIALTLAALTPLATHAALAPSARLAALPSRPARAGYVRCSEVERKSAWPQMNVSWPFTNTATEPKGAPADDATQPRPNSALQAMGDVSSDVTSAIFNAAGSVVTLAGKSLLTQAGRAGKAAGKAATAAVTPIAEEMLSQAGKAASTAAEVAATAAVQAAAQLAAEAEQRAEQAKWRPEWVKEQEHELSMRVKATQTRPCLSRLEELAFEIESARLVGVSDGALATALGRATALERQLKVEVRPMDAAAVQAHVANRVAKFEARWKVAQEEKAKAEAAEARAAEARAAQAKAQKEAARAEAEREAARAREAARERQAAEAAKRKQAEAARKAAAESRARERAAADAARRAAQEAEREARRQVEAVRQAEAEREAEAGRRQAAKGSADAVKSTDAPGGDRRQPQRQRAAPRKERELDSELEQERKRKVEEALERRRAEREEAAWAEVGLDVRQRLQEGGLEALTGEEQARVEAMQASTREQSAKEAADAVGALGTSLFGALLDIAGGALNGGESEGAQAAQDERRAKAREVARVAEQRARLALFEPELAIFGITLDEVGELDERTLRTCFRDLSRRLHPDLNPTGEGVRAEDFKDGVVPSIYEVNQAFEAIKRML